MAVQGGTECDRSLDSLVANERRMWIDTIDYDASDCFDSGAYLNETLDWNASWCHVHGGTACDRSFVSLVDTDMRVCIECKLTEEVMNEIYQGCDSLQIGMPADMPCGAAVRVASARSLDSSVANETKMRLECKLTEEMKADTTDNNARDCFDS